jgi:hypothetical protein
MEAQSGAFLCRIVIVRLPFSFAAFKRTPRDLPSAPDILGKVAALAISSEMKIIQNPFQLPETVSEITGLQHNRTGLA